MLSVAVVGGLHADARVQAVDRLLADVPGAVALHHDLATAVQGTVVRTVRDRTGIVSAGEAPLVNDCACCALREDLVPELERLAADGVTRLAIVELWDSVEPKAMAEVVASAGLRLTGVITAVDPALVLPYLGNGDDLADAGLAAAPTDQRTIADTFARQLEYAPVLALADSAEADDEDRALLAQLHPTAHRIPITPSGPDAGEATPAPSAPSPLAAAALAGFDVESAAAAQHPACALLPAEADECGVTTLVWHRSRPFHPERLYAALEDLACAAARSRGRFWLADRPDTLLHWDAAGGALCVE
ncbi:GTP-binding protein, partial [Streptomyces anthocyanicus]